MPESDGTGHLDVAHTLRVDELHRIRLVCRTRVVVTFAAAVNLPIMLGWVVFGRTWLADEVGAS